MLLRAPPKTFIKTAKNMKKAGPQVFFFDNGASNKTVNQQKLKFFLTL